MSNDLAIEALGLRKTYPPDVRALDGLSLAVPAGTIFGLLGPNGAGKSSLIRALLGLVKIASGEGRVLGLDVARDGLAVRRAVGYMPERDSHVPGMTGFEFVAYSGWLIGMSWALLCWAVERTLERRAGLKREKEEVK